MKLLFCVSVSAACFTMPVYAATPGNSLREVSALSTSSARVARGSRTGNVDARALLKKTQDDGYSEFIWECEYECDYKADTAEAECFTAGTVLNDYGSRHTSYSVPRKGIHYRCGWERLDRRSIVRDGMDANVRNWGASGQAAFGVRLPRGEGGGPSRL